MKRIAIIVTAGLLSISASYSQDAGTKGALEDLTKAVEANTAAVQALSKAMSQNPASPPSRRTATVKVQNAICGFGGEEACLQQVAQAQCAKMGFQRGFMTKWEQISGPSFQGHEMLCTD